MDLSFTRRDYVHFSRGPYEAGGRGVHRRDGRASPSPLPSPAQSWTHRGPVGPWFRFARIVLLGPPGCILALPPTYATEAPAGVEEEISLTYAVTAAGQVPSSNTTSLRSLRRTLPDDAPSRSSSKTTPLVFPPGPDHASSHAPPRGFGCEPPAPPRPANHPHDPGRPRRARPGLSLPGQDACSLSSQLLRPPSLGPRPECLSAWRPASCSRGRKVPPILPKAGLLAAPGKQSWASRGGGRKPTLRGPRRRSHVAPRSRVPPCVPLAAPQPSSGLDLSCGDTPGSPCTPASPTCPAAILRLRPCRYLGLSFCWELRERMTRRPPVPWSSRGASFRDAPEGRGGAERLARCRDQELGGQVR
ncbi:MAGE-like protein 2 [Ailuropoda melanoleuca]|uniref:MAGE-like protein 2 n=1 Tax=Ailuropoda melanoleuca TaxID=9646 RepID=UPI001494CE41|nr:MAGE-like protein 2 [Ailuropoda melanoleuca]